MNAGAVSINQGDGRGPISTGEILTSHTPLPVVSPLSSSFLSAHRFVHETIAITWDPDSQCAVPHIAGVRPDETRC